VPAGTRGLTDTVNEKKGGRLDGAAIFFVTMPVKIVYKKPFSMSTTA
jgi:hypothetical protein